MYLDGWIYYRSSSLLPATRHLEVSVGVAPVPEVVPAQAGGVAHLVRRALGDQGGGGQPGRAGAIQLSDPGAVTWLTDWLTKVAWNTRHERKWEESSFTK